MHWELNNFEVLFAVNLALGSWLHAIIDTAILSLLSRVCQEMGVNWHQVFM